MARSSLHSPSLDNLWRATAARLGFRVVRTDAAYASSDGASVIEIGSEDTLDENDALAQLVFHELCHAITEGEAGKGRPDWGLDNIPEHVVREHACLRAQAEIAGRYGLRALMAPTTPYRAYYEALPDAPIAATSSDPSVAIAVAAVAWFDASSWRAPIEAALAESAAFVSAAGGAADAVSSDARPSRHPLGFPLGPEAESCGTCAWLYVGGRGVGVARCRQSAPPNADGVRTAREHPACARWEPPVDCRTCGACCREAYHSVTVSVRDPVVWQEPALIERHGHRFEIRRDGDRCAALEEKPRGAFSCTIYEHRPRTCREFAANGRHCLDARRRVGLSPGRA
jgi:hypothetical protein